ncbi:FMN-dependent NADH-azoreductase [Pararobbsia silviterrae]|uniref:FMN dependent NADH:quinone oxidoreductase n=1 Tax=Pararobbsia silviterrae TaxID=1792498 RepID=A0A494XRZ6_9BURK|nr:NAD(P)H-dependent oxidoreductase [Pararobbsia silviterrae]RKP53375.1 FMN-dependent NADH-azoreductase [Pararobbsia silviterrae]
MRLLNIVSSPRGADSVSIGMANAFLDAYREHCPSVEIDTLNVWEENLPDFDAQGIGAKYKGVSKQPLNDAELSIWMRIQSLAKRFQRADRIVVGVPMWNFDYPYKLKQLIDLVSQRNMLFTFDGQTYGPALRIPRALVIHVRGQHRDTRTGIASPGFDHQADYIDFWLKFIGVDDVKRLTIEHTWDAQAHASIAHGKALARDLAADF